MAQDAKPPCGCGGSTRKGFLARASALIAGLVGLSLAGARASTGSMSPTDGGCDNPTLDLQFCWDEVWTTNCQRVCKIWCWGVWESETHEYCGSAIIDLGHC